MAAARRIALQLDLKWPYKRHTDVFAGTQRYAEEHGWESIIDEYVADNLPARRTKTLPYDGIIARANKRLAQRAGRLGVPLVNVWFTSPAWRQMPGVFSDFAAGGRLIAEHLLARGLRRFAALSTADRGAKAEVAAFLNVVREAGFPCLTEKLPLDPARSHASQQKSERRITDWMQGWELPIGVFVYGDTEGRIVAQICRRRGWRVPQDVAIVAGANEEQLCEYPRPSLTSLERGYQRIGYEAARLLAELMDERRAKREGKTDAKPQHIFIPPQCLVVRESTDFFAVEDELVAAALEFIAANSHRRIGQDDVSRAVNAETRTLQSRFRKVLDLPIAATIRQVRMERAKRELVQGIRLPPVRRAGGGSHPVHPSSEGTWLHAQEDQETSRTAA